MPGPSLRELLERVPPRWPFVAAWVEAQRADEPLEAEELLDLVYRPTNLVAERMEEKAHEEEEPEGGPEGEPEAALVEWLEEASRHGLAALVESEGLDGERWGCAAVASSWGQWKELVPGVARLVEVAVDRTATAESLAAAQAEHRGMKQGPPPPYVGHFHGALAALLRYRLTKRAFELSDGLSFACVAPDGTRRSKAIAACRDGGSGRSGRASLDDRASDEELGRYGRGGRS